MFKIGDLVKTNGFWGNRGIIGIIIERKLYASKHMFYVIKILKSDNFKPFNNTFGQFEEYFVKVY